MILRQAASPDQFPTVRLGKMRRPASHPAKLYRPVVKQGQDRIFWLEHTRSGEQMEYMRKFGKVLRHGTALLALVSLLVAAVLVAPASAQVLDYGKLFGMPGSEPAAAEPAASQPQQSLPVTGSIPGAGAGLSAADYARVAAAAPEPMLGAAQKAIRLFRERLVGTLRRSPGAFDAIGTTLAAASPTGRGIYCPFSGLIPPLSKRSCMFESHAEHAQFEKGDFKSPLL
jgi:hypothetical protein